MADRFDEMAQSAIDNAIEARLREGRSFTESLRGLFVEALRSAWNDAIEAAATSKVYGSLISTGIDSADLAQNIIRELKEPKR